MRLFVGVALPVDVAAAAEGFAEALRARLQHDRIHMRAAWVPRENLHVTLWFLGHVAPERTAAVEAALAPPLETPSFDIGLDGAGAFPPVGMPRVLWLAVREGREALGSIHRELAPRLAPIGFEPERREYSAHLTIARVKEAPRAATHAIRRILRTAGVAVAPSRVGSITLFRSHLSPGGPRYAPVLRIPLS